MRILPTLLLSLSMLAAARAELKPETVSYTHGDTELEGYHVHDDAKQGPRPGVLVVHQWTGLGDYEKRRSDQLAKLGYNVFAADIYGKGVRPQVPQAGEEAGKYRKDRGLYRARLMAALEQLEKHPLTEQGQVAAIGYCFGGTGVLELARAGAEVDGVVSFHGVLDAAEGMTAEKGKIPARILVLHGAADPYVPIEQVAGFQDEMHAADADWRMVAYGGAVHSFTQQAAGNDPTKGAAYDAEADQQSWEEMREFFNTIFAAKDGE